MEDQPFLFFKVMMALMTPCVPAHHQYYYVRTKLINHVLVSNHIDLTHVRCGQRPDVGEIIAEYIYI